MDMQHAPQISDDGQYGLVELTPVVPPSATPASAPLPPRAPATNAPKAEVEPRAKASGGGLFGKLLGKGKPNGEEITPPAPEPAPSIAPPESLAAATAATVATAPAAMAGPKPKAASSGPKLRSKKRAKSWKYALPAWGVSALVHVVFLGLLGVVAVTAEGVRKPSGIDSSMVDPTLAGDQANEIVHILAEPSSAPRDQAVGDPAATPGGSAGLGTGTGPPSATPRVSSSGSGVGEGSMPQVKVISQLSGLSLLPTASPSKDFSMRGGGGGGGGISGDVTMGTKDVGEALDQLAREILRHLAAHKLTVIWLFDESGSMKDDQRAVREKFGRVASELTGNMGEDKKAATALNHVVIGFGEALHPEISKPTTDVNMIAKAIDHLRVDTSGTENTCGAVARVVNEYAKQMKDGRRMLMVLVTDESGDDGQNVEDARQALVINGVPLYVIGRQSLFGYDRAHLKYIDPVTKEEYWPEIKRGPESADRETLQIDGLHERWDEQPSGFAPYELARLAKGSGGIYFLLPSEENMRLKQREKAYSIATLKEYVPSYDNRLAYLARREKSDLGRLIHSIIEETSKDYVHRRDYSIDIAECQKEILEEVPKARERLRRYGEMEKRLRAAKPLRDREPDKRWQAHYDLMLAQVVAYQVKAYEYLACLDEMADLMRKRQLTPTKMPIKDQLSVSWVINHSQRRKAPMQETEKKYAEGKQLLEAVIKNHANTPWADLAQDELNRGFGCQRDEEHHGPGYAERAKMVPKY